jgi:hypothetical protein
MKKLIPFVSGREWHCPAAFNPPLDAVPCPFFASLSVKYAPFTPTKLSPSVQAPFAVQRTPNLSSFLHPRF